MGAATEDPRVARRRAQMEAVLAAAGAVAQEEGLVTLSLHEVARRVGMRQPSSYAYVDSEAGLYDAMSAQAAGELLEQVTTATYSPSPREAVAEAKRRIVQCVAAADAARFPLLFLRTVPGFEPRPESCALSVQRWDWRVERLQAAGMHDPADVDLHTALMPACSCSRPRTNPAATAGPGTSRPCWRCSSTTSTAAPTPRRPPSQRTSPDDQRQPVELGDISPMSHREAMRLTAVENAVLSNALTWRLPRTADLDEDRPATASPHGTRGGPGITGRSGR